MRAGIDTGGTFTDLVFWDGSRLETHKVRSTPADPAIAIEQGLEGRSPGEIVHGSTVATNALLERKGARTAFVTTEGFEDLLVIARQNRAELYNFFAAPRPRLVPEGLTYGLPERVLADGTVEQPLPPEALGKLRRRLEQAGAESVAVCLLHAYANPAHEKAVGEALEGWFVSLSHQVLPEYREFERASTTLVNAYVSPLMGRYLRRLEERLAGPRIRVFQSNGGSIPAPEASRLAVNTVLSGPAGGVIGAAAAARAAGFERVISFDMGGTSTDVSLYDGEFTYTTEAEVGGFPLRVPMLDIHTVGAGGGSIAYLDAAGALRVGPQSAGADPGPVCYGAGEDVTVTDANVVLGRIDPERFLSGRMKLDAERAQRYVAAFAKRLGVSAQEAAMAIIRVANSNMERAIRVISVERGRDPREFALLAFGGAGAQHACELAERLEMRTVIVPRHAGVLSALGMLVADCVRDYSLSVLHKPAEEAFRELEQTAAQDFSGAGFRDVVYERHIDLRYRGQSFEITVPWNERERFARDHERLYGYAHENRAIEPVTARVRAIAVTPEAGRLDLAAPSDRQEFSSIHAAPGWEQSEDSAGNTILERAVRPQGRAAS